MVVLHAFSEHHQLHHLQVLKKAETARAFLCSFTFELWKQTRAEHKPLMGLKEHQWSFMVQRSFLRHYNESEIDGK